MVHAAGRRARRFAALHEQKPAANRRVPLPRRENPKSVALRRENPKKLCPTHKNIPMRASETKDYHHYRAFNLSFASSLPLPELSPSAAQAADVLVREGRVPRRLPAEDVQQEGWFFEGHLYYQIGAGKVLLEVVEAGRYLIQGGASITIQRRAGVSDDQVRFYLLGSCLGFLLLSRGLFALHGSAVTDGQRCWLFIGESGAGKSTTAAAFLQRGYRLLADDVSLVGFDEAGRALVYPAFPQIKLWEDSAQALAVEDSALKLILPDWEKYKMSVAQHFAAEPMPLAAIFQLWPVEGGKAALRRLEGMEKFRALSSNIYRGAAIADFGLQPQHFAFCSRLLQQFPVYQLERPSGGFQIQELLELLPDLEKP